MKAKKKISVQDVLAQAKKETLLSKAADSAMTACRLSYFQDPQNLEVLAQIKAGMAAAEMTGAEMAAPQKPTDQKRIDRAKGYYEQAADYALQAADLPESDASDKVRLQSFAKECLQNKNQPSAKAPQLEIRQPSTTPLLRSRAGSIFF